MKKNLLKFVLFVLFIAIFFIFSCYCADENLLDDCWNYHMIIKLNDGMIPYNDIPIIIPPLFHFICLIFFKILGESLYTFQFIGAIILSLLLLETINLLSLLCKKKICIISGVFVFLYLIFLLCIPNYNTLALLFIIMIIKRVVLSKQDCISFFNKKISKNTNNILIGFLFALLFLTKHSFAIFFAFFYLLYLISQHNKNDDKSNNLFAELKCIIIGALPLMIIFLVYLIANNCFIEFINMCFGGVLSFGQKNKLGSFSLLALILFVIYSIILWIDYLKTQDQISFWFLFVLFGTIFFSYPLFNDYHISIAIYGPTIGTIYAIDKFIISNNKKIILIFKPLLILGAIVFILIDAFSLIDCFNSINIDKIISNKDKTYGAFWSFDDTYYAKIERIHNYCEKKKSQGYEPYIISCEASLYEIPYRINSQKKLDLILNGNMGYNGEEKVITELRKY